MAVCLRCGKENDPDATFCNFCGKDLTQQHGSKKCPKCGTANPMNASFCNTCGGALKPGVIKPAATRVEEEIPPASTPAPPPPPVAVPEPSPERAIESTSESVPYCPWCQSPVGSYTRVCPHCNRYLTTGVYQVPSPVPIYEEDPYLADSQLDRTAETSGPTIAGILLILAGLAALGQGIFYLIAQDIASSGGYAGVDIGCCGGLDLIFALGAFAGGMSAIQRTNYLVSLLGSVCAILSLAVLVVGPLLGIIAILLVSLSKDQFMA